MPKDVEKAARLYQKAANLGEWDAAHALKKLKEERAEGSAPRKAGGLRGLFQKLKGQ